MPQRFLPAFAALLLCPALALAAPQESEEDGLPSEPCDYQALIGKRIVKDGEAQAPDTVRESDLPPLRRIARPEDPLTQDFNPGRVNLIVDDARTIRSISCW